jgi:hypothetical protein
MTHIRLTGLVAGQAERQFLGEPYSFPLVYHSTINKRLELAFGIASRSGMLLVSSMAVDFNTVRRIGLALPGVEESTSYGSPALKINGKVLAGIPVRRPEVEPGTLAVCVDFAERTELIAGDPSVYYVTNHYLGYPAVLVRLSHVKPDMLRELLGMAYKFATKTAAGRPPVRKRR